MHNSNNLSKSYKEIIKQHVFKYGDWIVSGNSFKTYVGQAFFIKSDKDSCDSK